MASFLFGCQHKGYGFYNFKGLMDWRVFWMRVELLCKPLAWLFFFLHFSLCISFFCFFCTLNFSLLFCTQVFVVLTIGRLKVFCGNMSLKGSFWVKDQEDDVLRDIFLIAWGWFMNVMIFEMIEEEENNS